jgi:hypothetical protein
LRGIAARIALASVAALPAYPAAAAPQRPTDDSLVLAVVSPSRSEGISDLRRAKAELARDPKDARLAVQVARLAIEQGRASSDPRLYGQAQAALASWWDDTDPPEELRVLRAVIRQALHDFSGALSDLDAILERSPGNTQARLTRAFVRLVLGDFAAAEEDCRAIRGDAGVLPAAACRARVAALTGDAPRGYAGLARALDFDDGSGKAMRRFSLSLLADMAAGLGRNDDADKLFADAAAIGAPDVPLLAAIADHLLDKGGAADVLALLDGKGDADALVLRRAIAAKRVGHARLAEWSAILNERFAAERTAGATLHLREEARFRLEVEGDAATALRLAVENWRTQKEPADARLVLEAAGAAGDPAAADDVVRFIRDSGLTDARMTPLLQRLAETRS